MEAQVSLFFSHIEVEALSLTASEEQHLQQQSIDHQHPGTILHDFQVLLDFLTPNGTTVNGAHNFLSMKSLAELNQRFSHPIASTLKRPQQNSFPYIHGLHLLLRTSGLTLVQAKGKKQQLVLDDAVLNAWHQLNLTEQYFNLLETWLLWSNDASLGDYQDPLGTFHRFTHFWSRIPEEGWGFANSMEQDAKLHYIKPHHAALLHLFGFITTQPGPAGKSWRIASLKKTPFGIAMMKVLTQALMEHSERFQSQTPFDFTYGSLQPVFQSYFPQWQQNLVIPGGEFEESIYVFKVCVLKVWRRIAIPNTLTLDDLSEAILDAFNFDRDHLYQFSYTDRFGECQTVIHPAINRPPHTNEILIGDLPLVPGNIMTYLYDFGDRWEFQVELENMEPPDPELSQPQVLATQGESPQQYWDENSWDGEWDAGDWNGYD